MGVNRNLNQLHHGCLIIIFSVFTVSAAGAQEVAQPTLDSSPIRGSSVGGSDEPRRKDTWQDAVPSRGRVLPIVAGDPFGNLRAGEQAHRTTRQSDPLWNGALIGAGAGVATGLVMCTAMEPWEICRSDVGPMLRFAAVGAGVGIAIDALIRGRRTDHEKPNASARLHAAPMIGRHARGVRIALRF